MNLQIEKMQVIEMLLSTEEASVIKSLKKILEKNSNSLLSKKQYDILNERRENHFNGTSKSFTLDEVKSNLLKKN